VDKESVKILPNFSNRYFWVNWALRQIGKRNLNLNKKAIETAKEIQRIDSRSAKWVASDAIRELTSEAVQERVRFVGIATLHSQ
jgi:hypothetical protein